MRPVPDEQSGRLQKIDNASETAGLRPIRTGAKCSCRDDTTRIHIREAVCSGTM